MDVLKCIGWICGIAAATLSVAYLAGYKVEIVKHDKSAAEEPVITGDEQPVESSTPT